MINKVTLIGNLGKDPEVRTLDSGTKVAQFPIATNENYQDREGNWQTKTEWHNVVMWRNLAERAEKSLKKGMLVYVEGKITNRKYTDQEGKDRYITEIVANTYRILDRKDSEGGGYTAPPPAEPNKSSSTTPAAAEPTEDDDLPF